MILLEKLLSSNYHDIKTVRHGTVIFCQRVSWESENIDLLTSISPLVNRATLFYALARCGSEGKASSTAQH